MEKRRFLIVLFFFLLFFLGSIDSEVKGALIPINGGGCVDRGAFCVESSDCCAGVCVDNSCSCLSNCCSLTSSIDGDRGDDCYCGRECRGGLTCIISTDGHKECCDDRSDWKRKAGVACYCHVECESGQCIGGVCFDPAAVDTCSPAGCFCVDSTGTCRNFGGEDDPRLDCPDPNLDICCCESVSPPLPPPPPPSSPCSDASDASRSCGCAALGVCRGTEGGEVVGYYCPSDVCCCFPSGGGPPPPPSPPPVDTSFPIGGNGEVIYLWSPLGCTTIEECISRMINFLFSLAVILTPLMIILAGFLYITAAGRPEKIVQAQKLITWTLIGFLIVSLARAIIYVITSVIGG